MQDCNAHAGAAHPAGRRAEDREIAEAALAALDLFQSLRVDRGERVAFFSALDFWTSSRDRILAKLRLMGGRA